MEGWRCPRLVCLPAIPRALALSLSTGETRLGGIMLLIPELEAKAGKSGIHSHFLLHSKFKTSLGYERLSKYKTKCGAYSYDKSDISMCKTQEGLFKLENPSS